MVCCSTCEQPVEDPELDGEYVVVDGVRRFYCFGYLVITQKTGSVFLDQTPNCAAAALAKIREAKQYQEDLQADAKMIMKLMLAFIEAKEPGWVAPPPDKQGTRARAIIAKCIEFGVALPPLPAPDWS
jgi:hypothetical protein